MVEATMNKSGKKLERKKVFLPAHKRAERRPLTKKKERTQEQKMVSSNRLTDAEVNVKKKKKHRERKRIRRLAQTQTLRDRDTRTLTQSRRHTQTHTRTPELQKAQVQHLGVARRAEKRELKIDFIIANARKTDWYVLTSAKSRVNDGELSSGDSFLEWLL